METVFDELKRYVDWSGEDEAALRELHPHAAPHFARIAELFYARILSHEGARAALVGGESRVGQLKVTLDRLDGSAAARPLGRRVLPAALPHRARPRAHRAAAALHVRRHERLPSRAQRASSTSEHLDDPEALRRGRTAVGKILDLELAIMLHTYREDSDRAAGAHRAAGDVRAAHRLHRPRAAQSARRHRVVALHPRRSASASDERAKKHIARIGEQLGVANGIISALLDMIRDRPLQREKVILDDTIASVLGSLATTTRIVVEGVATLPPVDVDPVQIRQVFMNLIENAVHAAGAGGRGPRRRHASTATSSRSPSRTLGPVSTPRRAGGCSSRSSRPRPRASGSAWRWCAAS